MAKKWGVDFRDSDGTQHSSEILDSGLPIYSTLSMARSVNEWAKKNMDKFQRNLLMSKSVIGVGKKRHSVRLTGILASSS